MHLHLFLEACFSSLVGSVQTSDILSDTLDVMTLASCWPMIGFFPLHVPSGSTGTELEQLWGGIGLFCVSHRTEKCTLTHCVHYLRCLVRILLSASVCRGLVFQLIIWKASNI